MENLISINNQSLRIKEYKGQRVVTFKDIDTVHGRPEGTAHRNFKANREHFIEGVDYYRLQKDEIRPFGITSPNGGIVVTESGYLMLVKSFTDDLAWTVQRELVNNYFRVKFPDSEQITLDELETDEYFYFNKTLNGEPVITINDFIHFTNVSRYLIDGALKILCKEDADYVHLKDVKMVKFRRENPSIKKGVTNLIVLKRSAVYKLIDCFKVNVEIPMITENSSAELPLPKPKEPTIEEGLIALSVLHYVTYIKKCVLQKSRNNDTNEKSVKYYEEHYNSCLTATSDVMSIVSMLF